MNEVRYDLFVRRVAPHRWRWTLYRPSDEATWASGDVHRRPEHAWASAVLTLAHEARVPLGAVLDVAPVVIDRRTWQGSFTVPKEQP